jgi:hypothetical protein
MPMNLRLGGEKWWRQNMGRREGVGGPRLAQVLMEGVCGNILVRNGRHFSYHTKLIPGDGSRISFWGEAWCVNVPLLEAYPGLYSLASNKEASIADNFDSVSGSRQWNISFVRSLNDWEVDDLVSLYSLLYTFKWGHGVDKTPNALPFPLEEHLAY